MPDPLYPLNGASNIPVVMNMTEGVEGQGFTPLIRPAFHLKGDKVVMTTAAVGGKPGNVGGTLSPVGFNANNEWKLTIADTAHQGFVVGEVTRNGKAVSFGDLGDDASEPFMVGEGSAAVTVKAIPGLKYTLKRTDSLRGVEDNAPYQEWLDVASETATGTTVTLTDDKPPADKAFYTIGVSVP